MNKLKYSLALLMIININALGSDLVSYTCKDEVITPKNIVELQGEFPERLASAMYYFLSRYPDNSYYFGNELISVSAQNEHHLRHMIGLISLEEFEQEVFSSAGGVINAVLQKNKDLVDLHARDNELALSIMRVENLSKNKYVFKCPFSSEWLIKVIHPSSRMVNLYASSGYNSLSGKLMDRNNEHVDIRKRATYQGVSCAQISMAVREFIDLEAIEHVYIPQTYVYSLLDTDFSRTLNDFQPVYRAVHDGNSLLMQEFVPGLQRLHENPDLISREDLITPEMARELKRCIEYGRLSGLSEKLAICMDDSSEHYCKLVLFSLEQPELTPSKDFVGVSQSVHNRIVKDSLKKMSNLFASRPDLVEVFQGSSE